MLRSLPTLSAVGRAAPTAAPTVALALALVVVAVASAPARADVLVVTAEHPSGYPARAIIEAVEAAQPGDTILITPGDYFETDPFTADPTIIVDKPLSLIGDEGGQTFTTGIYVTGLLPGERVVIANLVIRAHGLGQATIPLETNAGIDVVDSAGLVLIQDCDVAGRIGPLVPAFPATPRPGTPGLHVDGGGAVLVSRSVLRGGDGFTNDTILMFAASAGGEGLLVRDGEVAVHHGLLVGGNGGADLQHGTDGGAGGPGARLTDAELRFVGCELVGGAGGGGCTPGTAATCAGGDALAATGSLVHATGTSFSAGGGGALDGGGTAPDGAETLLVLSPLVSHADVPPRLVAPTAVRETEAGLITLEGLPGYTAFLYAGLDLGYAPLSGPKGVFVPAGTLLGPFPLGTVPGSGEIQLPFTTPGLAGLDAFAITLQGFTGPGVGFVLTNPHSLLLLEQGL